MSDEEERIEVSPEEAQIAESEQVTGDDDFSPFDEIREDFKPSALKRVVGADGLPETVAPTERSDIPVLSPETLVCMADTSSFVRRDLFGRIKATYAPSEVTQLPNGVYCLTEDVAAFEERLRQRREDPSKYHDLSGPLMTPVPVEPIRPGCKHYVRQMTGFELNAQHDTVFRLCAGRRTTEGTFMTVRDMKVTACTMREPRDLISEEKLEAFDRLKIEQGKHRESISIFSKG